jgi:DNA polymerase-3 subunit epsilon
VRFSKLERRLVARLLVLSLLPIAAGAAILAAASHLGPPDASFGTLALTAAGVAAFALFLAGVVLAVSRPLARAVEAMRLGTELMATVNPTFRLRAGGDNELAALAEEINRMADRLGEARAGLEREVQRATQELRVERGKLSAVLEALGDGVVVATPEGRVALANRVAHAMFEGGPSGLLGRSLFDLVDREKIAHFFERLQGAEGVERFTLHLPGGTVLAAAMTPLFENQGRPTGFILVCHDMTRLARREEERRPLLAQAVQALRGPLSSIRSLSESLLDEPSLVPQAARRLIEAINAEAVRLTALVLDMSEPTRLGLAVPPGHFETLSFSDLAAITLRRLRDDGDVNVELEADARAQEPSLQAEVSTMSAALAFLLRAAIRWRSPAGRSWLRVRWRGRLALIDAGVEGQATPADLDALIDAPLLLSPAGQATVREIVRKHVGEAWAYEDGGRIGFRITLPTSEHGEPAAGPGASRVPRFVGAGTESGFALGRSRAERPDFYDFSLFDEMERYVSPADRELALAEIRCVVFDLETTGLHPGEGDRIVSLAGVRVRDGALRRGEAFDALVNPRRPIPASSVRFHGITEAMVVEAPPINVVLPAFLRFAEGSVLVGHQVWFDVRFLALEAARLGLSPITLAHPILDTLVLSQLVHGSLPDHGLDTIAERLGVVVQGRHSALGDALATAEVFIRLMTLLKKRGIVTLGDALAAARMLQVSPTDDAITPGSGP